MELLVNRQGKNWHEKYLQAIVKGEAYAIIGFSENQETFYAVKQNDPVTDDMMPLYVIETTETRNGYRMTARRIEYGTVQAWVHLLTKDYDPNGRKERQKC